MSNNDDLPKIPKGAIRHPGKRYAVIDIAKEPRRGRRFNVMAVHYEEPDLRQVAKALVGLSIELGEKRDF